MLPIIDSRSQAAGVTIVSRKGLRKSKESLKKAKEKVLWNFLGT